MALTSISLIDRREILPCSKRLLRLSFKSTSRGFSSSQIILIGWICTSTLSLISLKTKEQNKLRVRKQRKRQRERQRKRQRKRQRRRQKKKLRRAKKTQRQEMSLKLTILWRKGTLL